MFRLGGHLSLREGLTTFVAAVRALDYNEVQVMLGQPRDYEPYSFDESQVREFHKVMYGVNLTVHLPYIINPCEASRSRSQFYKKVFREYVESALTLRATKLVIHPGFKKDLSEEEALKNLVNFFQDVWDESIEAELLLEGDSGSKNGSAVGSLAFIEKALDGINMPNTGICLDTAHIYARGENVWDDDVRRKIIASHKPRIKLVHLNVPDREVLLGSNRDRHNTAFEDRPSLPSKNLIEDFSHFPMILERRSLQVQKRDNLYVRRVLGFPLERKKA